MNATPVSLAAFFLSAVALLTALFAIFMPDVEPADARRAEAEMREGALLQHMVLYQRYAEKLHAAGTAGNWLLADFYAEEIEENTERLAALRIIEEGVNVSALAEEIMAPAAQRVVAASAARDAERFALVYRGLVSSCNRCHQTAGHEEILIQVPAGPSFPSQRFAPALTAPDSAGAP